MVRSLHKSYDRLLSRFEHVWTLQLSGHAGWSAGKHGVLPQDFVRKLAWACDPGVANCTFYSLPTWEPDTVALRWRVLWNWKLKKKMMFRQKIMVHSQPLFQEHKSTERRTLFSSARGIHDRSAGSETMYVTPVIISVWPTVAFKAIQYSTVQYKTTQHKTTHASSSPPTTSIIISSTTIIIVIIINSSSSS